MISSTRRENYKALLGCTDSDLDRLFKIVFEANLLGMNIDIDIFISNIAKKLTDNELELSTFG